MVKKPIVLIVYSGNDSRRRDPFRREQHSLSYRRLYALAAEEYGIHMVRASILWFDGKVFTKYWEVQNDKWVLREKTLQPDLVIDKTPFEYDKVKNKMALGICYRVLNPWEMDVLATDKLLTETAFYDITVPSYSVSTHADVERALKKLKGKEFIYKPRLGNGGKGIEFFTRDSVNTLPKKGMAIVQPVIDSSRGIPGLVNTTHDFRIIVGGEKPVAALIRTPAEGGRLCNIALGGKGIDVPLNKIPKELKPIIARVVEQFRLFPEKLFFIDFFFDHTGKPYVIEVNTKPLMSFPEEYRALEIKVQKAHLQYIRSLLNN